MSVKCLNHIGVAVRSIDEQKSFYEDTLGLEFEGIEDGARAKKFVLRSFARTKCGSNCWNRPSRTARSRSSLKNEARDCITWPTPSRTSRPASPSSKRQV